MLQLLCAGILMENVVTFIFLVVDDYVPQTCADTAHFYERQPFCVFQSYVDVGCEVFVNCMMMGIAFQLWSTVVLKVIAWICEISH
jgi:hypothetical protein